MKYIHLGCVGYNNLDVEKLKDKKIILSNSSNIVEGAMAEMVLTAIMWFNKRIYEIDENHKISRKFYNNFYNNLRLLSDTKVLVYGYGLVGKKTVDLLKNFTSHITIVKREVKNSSYEFVINPQSALKVVDKYDYIVNCLPLNKSSTKYFNKDYFKLMNPQSVYINIGRSGTTEINDLINEINLKKIRGTYLDVYDETDLKKLNPLKNNRILVTPHISGWHNEYWLKQSKLCISNFINYKEGNYKQLENLIIL